MMQHACEVRKNRALALAPAGFEKSASTPASSYCQDNQRIVQVAAYISEHGKELTEIILDDASDELLIVLFT